MILEAATASRIHISSQRGKANKNHKHHFKESIWKWMNKLSHNQRKKMWWTPKIFSCPQSQWLTWIKSKIILHPLTSWRRDPKHTFRRGPTSLPFWSWRACLIERFLMKEVASKAPPKDWESSWSLRRNQRRKETIRWIFRASKIKMIAIWQTPYSKSRQITISIISDIEIESRRLATNLTIISPHSKSWSRILATSHLTWLRRRILM